MKNKAVFDTMNGYDGFLEAYRFRGGNAKFMETFQTNILMGTPSWNKSPIAVGVIVSKGQFQRLQRFSKKDISVSKAVLNTHTIDKLNSHIIKNADNDCYAYELVSLDGKPQFYVLPPLTINTILEKNSSALKLSPNHQKLIDVSVGAVEQMKKWGPLHETPKGVNGQTPPPAAHKMTLKNVIPKRFLESFNEAKVSLTSRLVSNNIKTPIGIKGDIKNNGDLRVMALLLPIKGTHKKTVEEGLRCNLDIFAISTTNPGDDARLRSYVQDNANCTKTSKIIVDSNGMPLGMLITTQDYPKIAQRSLGVPAELNLNMAQALNILKLQSQTQNNVTKFKDTKPMKKNETTKLPSNDALYTLTMNDIKPFYQAVDKFKPSNNSQTPVVIPVSIGSRTAISPSGQTISGLLLKSDIASQVLSGTGIRVSKRLPKSREKLSMVDFRNTPGKVLAPHALKVNFARAPYVKILRKDTPQDMVFISLGAFYGLAKSGRLRENNITLSPKLLEHLEHSIKKISYKHTVHARNNNRPVPARVTPKQVEQQFNEMVIKRQRTYNNNGQSENTSPQDNDHSNGFGGMIGTLKRLVPFNNGEEKKTAPKHKLPTSKTPSASNKAKPGFYDVALNLSKAFKLVAEGEAQSTSIKLNGEMNLNIKAMGKIERIKHTALINLGQSTSKSFQFSSDDPNSQFETLLQAYNEMSLGGNANKVLLQDAVKDQTLILELTAL